MSETGKPGLVVAVVPDEGDVGNSDEDSIETSTSVIVIVVAGLIG